MSNEPRSIHATRIGGHAYRYLTTRPRPGRVVSSFSGGTNIVFEDGEAFIPIQSSAVPLHPWAIELPGGPLRFTEGTPVIAEGGELAVRGMHILLSAARIDPLSLPQFSAGDVEIARRNLPLLARFVEEDRKERPPDPFQLQIDAILEQWHEVGDPSVLLDLIGLGAGSTPSGDDVLVGILAGMYLLEGVNGQVGEVLIQLRTSIQETVRPRTPLPSAQMILSACDRSFPEPVRALLNSLASPSGSEDDLLKSAAGVAGLGHHSGIVTLEGLTHVLRGHPMWHFKTNPEHRRMLRGV